MLPLALLSESCNVIGVIVNARAGDDAIYFILYLRNKFRKLKHAWPDPHDGIRRTSLAYHLESGFVSHFV